MIDAIECVVSISRLVEKAKNEGVDVLLYGHTHIPMCEEKEGIICCNPGSVSIPKNSSAHSVMVYENGEFRRFDLETGAEYTL